MREKERQGGREGGREEERAIDRESCLSVKNKLFLNRVVRSASTIIWTMLPTVDVLCESYVIKKTISPMAQVLFYC